jgi:hypothetical protein
MAVAVAVAVVAAAAAAVAVAVAAVMAAAIAPGVEDTAGGMLEAMALQTAMAVVVVVEVRAQPAHTPGVVLRAEELA